MCLSQDQNLLFINCANGDIKIWNLNPEYTEESIKEEKILMDGDIKNSQIPIPLVMNNKQLLISVNLE